MANEILLAYVTIPDEKKAQVLARNLVEEGFCAGVNIIGPIRSTYHWRGETRLREEWLLLAQTTTTAWAAFEKFVREEHSDIVPCVIGLPADQVFPPFRAWIMENATRHNSD